MKRNLLALAVVAGALGFAASGLRADPPAVRIGIGIGPGGVHIGGGVAIGLGHARIHRGPRHVRLPVYVAPPPRVVHVHHRVPVYNRVWVPARYGTVIVGYGFSGAPIYGTACVSPGHWENVLVGYRCASCGITGGLRP